jgi:hypothetical protein
MKLTIIGDVHGNWKCLTKLLRELRSDIVICCGEFGFWPRSGNVEGTFSKLQVPKSTRFWWIDGNHEDFDSLERPHSLDLLPSRVTYIPRGTIKHVPGLGWTLFMGGAESIDKEWRTPGMNWFFRESISALDMMKVNWDAKVDTIVSHTCPREFTVIPKEQLYDVPDGSRDMLSELLERFKPTRWFFSHWHRRVSGRYIHEYPGVCDWVCLDSIDYGDGSGGFMTVKNAPRQGAQDEANPDGRDSEGNSTEVQHVGGGDQKDIPNS